MGQQNDWGRGGEGIEGRKKGEKLNLFSFFFFFSSSSWKVKRQKNRNEEAKTGKQQTGKGKVKKFQHNKPWFWQHFYRQWSHCCWQHRCTAISHPQSDGLCFILPERFIFVYFYFYFFFCLLWNPFTSISSLKKKRKKLSIHIYKDTFMSIVQSCLYRYEKTAPTFFLVFPVLSFTSKNFLLPWRVFFIPTDKKEIEGHQGIITLT